MSSTNRGYDRHATDYYVTPQEPILTFLDAWLGDIQKGEFEFEDIMRVAARPDTCVWFDPCAGGDAKNEMSYPAAIKKAFGVDVATLDIRDDSRAEEKGDYLNYEIKDWQPDVIITNPPFYLAKEIIEKALKDVAYGGYVVMLLRLNFFGSKNRFEFFQKNMPIATYVHHRRFSFTEDGKTDSIEYMHAVWQRKSSYPKFSKLRVI